MSSVQTPAKDAATGTRKKRSWRQRIESLAYTSLGPGNGGFPIDVSEGGMAFQGIQPLEKDQIISVSFKLPGTNEVVETSGQIVWLNDLGKGGGLKFVDVPEASRNAINRWLASQEKAGADVPHPPIVAELKSAPSSASAGIPTTVNSALLAATNIKMPQAAPNGSPMRAAGTVASKTPSKGIRPAVRPRMMFQVEANKRTPLRPLAIALVTCVAILVGMLVMSGVIPVQFHWSHSAAQQTSPITESVAPRAPDAAITPSAIAPISDDSLPASSSQDSSDAVAPANAGAQSYLMQPAD